MFQWNSEQYLKFKSQRTQPAVDLAKRISLQPPPESILDIGCGPGNSTAVLKELFPKADIIGVDNSENMIKKATELNSGIRFQVCDITTDLENLGKYDVIFSNACLQWVPYHGTIIPKIFSRLNKNGMLAVQMPINLQERLFQIITEVISEGKWNFSSMNIETSNTLTQEEYFDILSSCTDDFDIWETVYYHKMPSVEAMVEWVKGTRLRPYISALDKEKADMLEKEITDRAKESYIAQKNSEIIFKFRRLFFTAVKPN